MVLGSVPYEFASQRYERIPVARGAIVLKTLTGDEEIKNERIWLKLQLVTLQNAGVDSKGMQTAYHTQPTK